MLKLFTNKKLKIVLSVCACVLSVISIIGATALIIRPKQAETDNTPTVSTPNAVTYDIRYYAVEDGTVVDVYADMYRKGGKYPTSYAVGNSLYVDDLLGKMTPVSWDGWISYISSPVPDRENPNKDYSFYGWYTDIECTKEFEQGKRYAGDITLYAKVEVGYWTSNH